MVSFIKKMVGDTPERAAQKLRGQLVPQVNRLEDSIKSLSDDGLRAKTDEFRARLDNGESPDSLLYEAFAVVREAARRTLGQRHYDVQLIGGTVLHQGKIAEMKTGEGKTLVATLPAYLNALTGDGVHIVTVNDYLARRDPVWMGPIYHLLGLTVGCLQHDAAYLYDPELTEVARGGFQYLTPSNDGTPIAPTSYTAPTTSSVSITSATTWPWASSTRCRVVAAITPSSTRWTTFSSTRRARP